MPEAFMVCVGRAKVNIFKFNGCDMRQGWKEIWSLRRYN